jgi:leucyl aminopeptidase
MLRVDLSADALSYTIKKIARVLVGMAKLTSSNNVVLGWKLGSIIRCTQFFADELIDVGNRPLEALWQLPLPGAYREILRSEGADIHTLLRNLHVYQEQ